MINYGDYVLGSTVRMYFPTTDPDTGATIVFGGTPAISVYRNGSTTQITAGVSLTVSLDAITGLNYVEVVASAGNGYSRGDTCAAVVTTGTVDGQTAVGYVVGVFTIEACAVPLANVVLPDGATPAFGIVDAGTAAGIAAGTITLRAGAAFGDNVLAGDVVAAFGSDQGYWQYGVAASNVGSTDVVTMQANWPVTPSGTVSYVVFGSPSAANVLVGLADGAITSAKFGAGAINSTVLADGAITSAKFAAAAITATVLADNALTAAKIANDALTSAKFADNAITAAKLAADAITAAKIAADAIAEIQAGLATAAALSVVAGYLDTEIAAIKAKTDLLNFDGSNRVVASSAVVGGVPLGVGGTAPAAPLGQV